MSLPYVLAIALALAMDVLAVSLAVGLSRPKLAASDVVRMASAFGLFQAGMTLLGAFAGANLVRYIQGVDHWVAAGLLVFVGVRMGYESFKPPHLRTGDPTRGAALIVLAVATSLDALAVGLGLAALKTSLAGPALVIGAVAAAMTVFGLRMGPRLGRYLGRWAEILGGLVLILIAARVLFTHLRG